MTYEERLIIPITQHTENIYSHSGKIIAHSYRRIVIGGRGPYIEFNLSDINQDEFFIPNNGRWRVQSPLAYYSEWRSKGDNIKMYFQKKPVEYADYRIGLFYISPFDVSVMRDNKLTPCITKVK